MDLHQMPGHLIRRLNQHSTQVFQTRVKEAGLDLTPVQFAAMRAIAEAPEVDQATVAARIGYDRATIGGVIDRLLQKGWIARRVSDRDRRAREVMLTPAGEAVLDQALPMVAGFQAEILTGLTQEERITFLALARKVTSAFGES